MSREPGPTLNLVHLARVTSTMDALDDLAAAGAPEWTVVLADEQTAGLGRAGRTWEAEAGSALLCSILVRPRFAPERMGMLAIAAGVAIAEHLDTLGVAVTLKWPNDVLLHGRKLAGILIRTRHDAHGLAANVGIGLNLTASDGSRDDRAALSEAVSPTVSIPDLITAITRRLASILAGNDTSALRDAWNDRAALVGEDVTVVDGARSVGGVLLGIDESGALLLGAEDGGVRSVAAGDVVRGPRRGAA